VCEGREEQTKGILDVGTKPTAEGGNTILVKVELDHVAAAAIVVRQDGNDHLVEQRDQDDDQEGQCEDASPLQTFKVGAQEGTDGKYGKGHQKDEQWALSVEFQQGLDNVKREED
jgi:hypothetical protein